MAERADSPVAGQRPGPRDVTFVLIHGAWHAASCSGPLSDELTRLGVGWVAVDLVSSGRDPLHLGSADDDVAVVCDLAGTKDRVVLVGHSYGAAVASFAAAKLQSAIGLVAIAGLIPDRESSTASLVQRGGTEALAASVEAHQGYLTIAPDMAREVFYGMCSDEVAMAAVAALRCQSTSSVRASGEGFDSSDVPLGYIVCKQDAAIRPDFQRAHATERDAAVVEIDADHSPMLSNPQILADSLLDLVEVLTES